MKWDIQRDREGIVRLAKLAAICLVFLVLVRNGLAPGTRILTLSALACAFSMAALYELQVRDKPQTWSAISMAMIGFFCFLTYCLLQYLDPPEIEGHGPLIATNEKTPPNDCDHERGLPPDDSLLMLFGSDGIVGWGRGPFVPIRAGSCPALTFRREAGGLLVDSFGYDSDGNVVYRIRRNDFEQLLRGFLRARRPDPSTLQIIDEKGRVTLAIRYLNRNAVKVSGVFRCGDTHPVAIGVSDVRIGGKPTRGQACQVLAPGPEHAIVYSDGAG